MSTFERHVLYVDDDPEGQQIIKDMLEPRGIHLTVCDNGQRALKMMKRGLQPDVIISGLDMPRMNGIQFLEAVRREEDWAPIPFIILTSHSDKASIRKAYLKGADDYLVKPIDEERLALTIYSRAKRIQELTRYAEVAHETLAYMRRDMARMFTHELRTPLASMEMVLEVLTRQGGDVSSEDSQEFIETMQTGVTRLSRLVEQMVLLNQLDTGELQKLIAEASRPGPLWDGLTAAVSRARSFSHRQRNVAVEYNHGDVGGEIMAEWKSLRHALAEILSNAMAFSPKGEPVVVSQWLEDKHISISITDYGPGIPEDRQGDLFRRFNQVERDRHDQQGIGMGLYLSKSIVEATGGTLDLKSGAGQGTTVTVHFPLIK
jgi:two-component system sensor histidine kinase/response regulator